MDRLCLLRAALSPRSPASPSAQPSNEAPMRILYSHRIGSRDGQSVHVEELVAALRQAGHEVLVVGPRIYEKAELGGASGLVSSIRRLLPGAVNEVAELAYNIPAYRRLHRACRSFKPHLSYER